MHIKAALLAVTITVMPMFSQSNPTTLPPTGDPYVLLMFLQHQDSLVQSIQKQTAVDAPTAAVTEQSIARSFNMNIADFRTANAVYQSVKAQMDAVDVQGLSYVRQAVAQKQAPDVTVLQSFDTQIRNIIQDAAAKLQQNLSAAGWSSMKAYVDGEFKSKISRKSLQ